jgi:hypothetical protein
MIYWEYRYVDYGSFTYSAISFGSCKCVICSGDEYVVMGI